MLLQEERINDSSNGEENKSLLGRPQQDPPNKANGCCKPHVGFGLASMCLYMVTTSFAFSLQPQILVELCKGNIERASRMQGFLSPCNAFATFFSSPFLGLMSDRFGRKPIFVLSLIGSFIDIGGYLFASDVWMLFITRSLSGMFGGFMVNTYAYIADTTSNENRAVGFGMIGVAIGLGLTGPPILSGYLAEKYWLRFPLYVSQALNAFNLLFILFLLPESKENAGGIEWRRANPLQSFALLRHCPLALGLAILYFFVNLSEEGIMEVFMLYLKYRFHWGSLKLGIVISVLGICIMLQGPLAKFIIPRLGERKSILTAIGVNALSAFPIGLITRGWMLYPLFVFRSIALIAQPTIQGEISKQYSAERQGELLGVIGGLRTLTQFLGPLLFDNLFSFFISKRAPVIISGIAFYVASIMFTCCFFGALLLFKLVADNPVKLYKTRVNE